MSVLQPPLAVGKRELRALQSAMRDVQVTIGDYYASTSSFDADPDELATRVRANASFVQVLNDLVGKELAASDVYKAMFQPPIDRRAEIIQAFKYVRNVMQHIRHPVLPMTASVVGGLGLGYRTYAVWQEVPRSVHNRLHKHTKPLKRLYNRLLKGHEVTQTMLDAAQFFATVSPAIVHTQANGEWTGFPLAHQAGVVGRLHPQEPLDPSAATAWMDSRRPGGDLRVVCGCMNDAGHTILFGLTFVRDCAFVPFFETVEQLNTDIARGFSYFEGNVAANTSEVGALFGVAPHRSVLRSNLPIEEWAGEVEVVENLSERSSLLDIDQWRTLWLQEAAAGPTAFVTRRERRLNASAPDGWR